MSLELVLTRIWVEANEIDTEETIKRNKIGIHPADIHYYEEYVGAAMRNYTDEPVTTITLYTQEILFLAMPFEELNKTSVLLPGAKTVISTFGAGEKSGFKYP